MFHVKKNICSDPKTIFPLGLVLFISLFYQLRTLIKAKFPSTWDQALLPHWPYDEITYAQGVQYLSSHSFGEYFYDFKYFHLPPGNSAYLWLASQVFFNNLFIIRLLNVTFSILSLVLLAKVCKPHRLSFYLLLLILGTSTAVGLSATILTEPLYTFLLTFSLWLLSKIWRESEPDPKAPDLGHNILGAQVYQALILGLVCFLAAITRYSLFAWPFFWAFTLFVYAFIKEGRKLFHKDTIYFYLRHCVWVGFFLMFTLLWSTKNYWAFGQFTPLTGVADNLYLGMRQDTKGDDPQITGKSYNFENLAPNFLALDQTQKQKVLLSKTQSEILQNPSAILSNMLAKVGRLTVGNSDYWFGPQNTGWQWWVKLKNKSFIPVWSVLWDILSACFFWVLVCFGLWRSLKNRPSLPALSLTFYLVLAHLPLMAIPRYGYPIWFTALPIAAEALQPFSHLTSTGKDDSSPRKYWLLVALATLAVFLFLASAVGF